MGCLQMQQRLKKMQENIHMLVDGPLKTAEATFELERSELRGRIVQLEQESAQLKAEHRGTLRPLTLSQFISSMHCARCYRSPCTRWHLTATAVDFQ